MRSLRLSSVRTIQTFSEKRLVEDTFEETFQKRRVSLFSLQEFKGIKTSKFLQHIEAQNEDIKISQYKVQKGKEKRQILKICIHQSSCQIINKDWYNIRYRFGKIPVNGFKKEKSKAQLTPTEETSVVLEECTDGMHSALL